jgi:uncharacterized protein
MEDLLIKSNRKLPVVDLSFKRSLFEKINFDQRLIALKGARGTGKTTMLLQYGRMKKEAGSNVLYVALDDLFFKDQNLYDLAEWFYQNNGKYLLLDEVHKYPGWSREIKLIYDDFPGLFVFFSSSSILDIYKAESDLSRRVVTYILPELSLREFIVMESGIALPTLDFNDLLVNHQEISESITQKIKPLYEFGKYLKYGQYPYFIEGVDEYYQKVLATINLILEIDIKAIVDIDYNNIVKLKRLLYSIATSVPFMPNISKLSNKIEVSRPYLIKALNILEKSQLLKQLQKSNKGISYLSKPDKIYLNNTNLIYTLAGTNAEKGNLRETFFLNQVSVSHDVKLPPTGDFSVEEKFIFEIGGKNKSAKQIYGQENSFLVRDDIETGTGQSIPLWLFGFLY